MVKIKRSSDELDCFLSRVYVSPKHAASFSGLDKLYMTKNQFPSIMRKEIQKWAENNLILYTSPLEEPLNETRCMLPKLIVYGKLTWLLYKM